MSITSRKASEVYRDGPRELCHCHGKPMYWHASTIHRGGGRWRCAVDIRSAVRERLREPGERARKATSPALQRRLAAHRQLIARELERRGGACVVCGATGHLDWHHRNPATRDFSIPNYRAPDRVRAELAKCDPVCRSCHLRMHRSGRMS